MKLLLAGIVLVAIVVILALHARPKEEKPPPKDKLDDLRPLLRGINYLLTDQPDQALRTLIEVAHHHSELAEVYLALGEMFRARGEYMRAVRIHQSLLARPNLSAELQLQAAWALAKDYHAGGLLDRALRQYARVLELAPDHLPALEASLRIREDSSEWDEALKLLARIERLEGNRRPAHRAALLAQKALQALQQGQLLQAQSLADEALALDRSCGAAWLVHLRSALQRDDADQTCKVLHDWREHAQASWPAAVAEAAQRASSQVRDGVFRWLRAHTPDEAAALFWIENEYRLGGVRAAEEAAKALGMEQPQSLRSWIRLQAFVRSDRIGALARDWSKTLPNWRCKQCGVELREIRWRCPQCHQWNTMQPITEEDACAPPS